MRSWKSPDIYKPIPRNVIVYDGPSLLTGDPIIVVVSAQNGNRKIGHMLQLWIMLRDVSPIQTVKTGTDRAVCGDCNLRGDGHGRRRVCYVETFRSVENIWQARGKAQRLTPEAFADVARGLQLRIGAYGDPVAVPLSVWLPLLAVCGGWTAYSHSWKRADDAFKAWCMASVDTDQEQAAAAAQGWRTFRVRPVDGPVLASEVICPHERDDAVKCAGCSLCRGAARPAKHVVVTVHGVAGRKHFGGAPGALIPIKSLRQPTAVLR